MIAAALIPVVLVAFIFLAPSATGPALNARQRPDWWRHSVWRKSHPVRSITLRSACRAYKKMAEFCGICKRRVQIKRNKIGQKGAESTVLARPCQQERMAESTCREGSPSLRGAVAMGTGVMAGAGVFALTGQVADVAGSRWVQGPPSPPLRHARRVAPPPARVSGRGSGGDRRRRGRGSRGLLA